MGKCSAKKMQILAASCLTRRCQSGACSATLDSVFDTSEKEAPVESRMPQNTLQLQDVCYARARLIRQQVAAEQSKSLHHRKNNRMTHKWRRCTHPSETAKISVGKTSSDMTCKIINDDLSGSQASANLLSLKALLVDQICLRLSNNDYQLAHYRSQR